MKLYASNAHYIYIEVPNGPEPELKLVRQFTRVKKEMGRLIVPREVANALDGYTCSLPRMVKLRDGRILHFGKGNKTHYYLDGYTASIAYRSPLCYVCIGRNKVEGTLAISEDLAVNIDTTWRIKTCQSGFKLTPGSEKSADVEPGASPIYLAENVGAD